jgi:predicted Fe-Mo cluster-binding NifX family protein
MKLCIPTRGDEGRLARVSGHFGRAPWFTVLDTETGETISFENAPGEDGRCFSIDSMLVHGVGAVACHHLGHGAMRRLQERGVQVLQTQAVTVAGVLEEMRAVAPIEMDAAKTCSGHEGGRNRHGDGCGHGHGHGHEHHDH